MMPDCAIFLHFQGDHFCTPEPEEGSNIINGGKTKFQEGMNHSKFQELIDWIIF